MIRFFIAVYVNWKDPKTWRRIHEGFTHGIYERVYSDQVDRVWLVSKKDALFSKFGMGARACDVIPNGVDSEYFVPMNVESVQEVALSGAAWTFGQIWTQSDGSESMCGFR